ncbi:hypothetical protein EZV76_01020 [Flagellimonas alvinocaridis]|uniref:DUF6265 domain-containing protein n=1 Tax=Flagellimonas alvinocaridis TaxID=2530200 RepID=A0A4V4HXG8_9FLAO|nr:DUF6265 family protein [Allomuricauda alvinocaridis]THV60946.1 hypothetical protein EZV76_01020 [Allomuricauda alvinocaridis]
MRTAIILFLFHVGMVSAQETLQLTDGQQSPSATLEDVSWISGHWQGEAFGGIAEEIWSPPLGDSMMFVFKLVKDNKVSFYEIGHIQQVENTMILQLKHFQGDLKGWEEKDATVDFKLVKVEKNKVFFEGFTMELVNENEMNIYVLIEDGDSAEEVLFAYKRVP